MGKPGFERAHHVAFFDAMATELPGDYDKQEVNHLTLSYFALGGLSLLRELDRVRSRALRRDASFVDPLEELRGSFIYLYFFIVFFYIWIRLRARKKRILITCYLLGRHAVALIAFSVTLVICKKGID
ncbi:hypothetical protein BS78_03G064500 [Paspalum vaginatum]|nr:hypothetical protein BS78_03G064500 [Paspalum vaginatum]